MNNTTESDSSRAFFSSTQPSEKSINNGNAYKPSIGCMQRVCSMDDATHTNTHQKPYFRNIINFIVSEPPKLYKLLQQQQQKYQKLQGRVNSNCARKPRSNPVDNDLLDDSSEVLLDCFNVC